VGQGPPYKTNGSLTERHNTLRRKTKILKNILREKKEKQEKENKKVETQEENPASQK